MIEAINGSDLTKEDWEHLQRCISDIEMIAKKGGFVSSGNKKNGTLVSIPSKRSVINGSNVFLVNGDGSSICGQNELKINAEVDCAVSCDVNIVISGFVFEE